LVEIVEIKPTRLRKSGNLMNLRGDRDTGSTWFFFKVAFVWELVMKPYKCSTQYQFNLGRFREKIKFSDPVLYFNNSYIAKKRFFLEKLHKSFMVSTSFQAL
jgi:hypothetical protein